MFKGDENTPFRLGTWLVEPDLNRLSDGDRIIAIEPRLMDVLTYLASQPGKTISADELLETVWHGRAHVDNTIYQAVAHLRKELGDDVHQPRFIETIAKKGYRLIGPVTSVAEDHEDLKIEISLSSGSRHRRRFLALAAGIASLAALIFLTSNPGIRDQLFQSNEGPSDRSVAVLPFVDMSEDGNQQYLSDGVTEELIHVLSNLPDLRVIARTSSFAFRDSNEDVRQIGNKLNVATVLEGSVRKDGDRIRVTSQLVDTRNGFHLWSQTFERRTTDLFSIQNEIAVAVARTFEYRELDALMTDGRAMRPEKLQAYDHYLLGLHKLRMNLSGGTKLATQHFKRAIEMDPSYARAYAGLSESYASRYWHARDQELLDKAESAAKYALLLDDQSAEAFAALGFVRAAKQDYSGAEEAYTKAVALNPNDGHTYMYLAFNISRQGREEEAFVMVTKALELDPMSGRLNNWMGHHYNKPMPYRDWDTAFKYFKRAMDRDPDFAWSYRAVGWHYRSIGELDQAIPYFRKVVDLTSSPTNAGMYVELLAMTFVDIGDYASAAQVIHRTKELEPDHFGAINSEIHLQLARGDFVAARDIVHGLLPKYIGKDQESSLLAFYEMVIGDTDHAEEIYAHLMAQEPGPDGGMSLYRGNELRWGMMSAVNLAYLHRRNGHHQAAAELLSGAREFIESRRGQLMYVCGIPYVLAQIAAIEGNNNAAIEHVREAVETCWAKVWFGRIDPIMAELRKDVRFMQNLEDLEDKLSEMREHPKMLASNEA
jgi:TolB-like protein/DNA-binding winged helix-turn-helix (wHTH) protein/Tfp pilus assembly protein PilF